MPREEIKEFRAAGGLARITAETAEGEAKLPTFAGNAYTGAVMQPGGWYGSIICDLAGIKVPQQHRPVLRQHDDNRIIGHTTSVNVDAEGVQIAGVFSGLPDMVADVTAPAKNGFQWQLSIGAVPLRTEFLESGQTTVVNGREVTGPLTISRETELKEISFVPLGADGNTSVAVSASHRRGAMFKAMLMAAIKNGEVKAGKYSDDEINKMSEEEAKSALKKMMDDDESSHESKAKAEDEEKKTDAEDEEEKTAAKASTYANRLVAQSRKAIAAEEKRINEIRIKAKGHPEIIAKAIENGWTVEKAELEALRASRPGAGVGGPHILAKGQPQIDEAVVECAVMQAASPTDFKLFDASFFDRQGDRAAVPAHLARRVKAEMSNRYTDRVQQTAWDMFRGRIGLHQVLATSAAIVGGYNGSQKLDDSNAGEVLRIAANRGFQADGTSNYSLSNVLANVLNKMMLAGYLFVEQTWREVAAIRSVPDFKATRNISLFGDLVYDEVGSTGELKNATLGDQAFANQANQYGKIMTIDRKSIINDDLGALTTVPMLMGRGASLRLNKNFWSVFLNPGNADDGNAFWNNSTNTHGTPPAGQRAAYANLFTGGATALSSTSLNTAVTAFSKQVDPAGEPLGVEAETLLYPPELDTTARELMNSQFIVYGGASAAKQPANNVFQGRFKPVMSRYLSNTAYTGNSATAWYLLSSPTLFPVIECAFLNGVDTPTVQQAGIDYQFDRLGISIRGVFDFGVNIQNFRGGVKMAGA